MASTLSRSSTDDEVWSSYDDNASWEEDESSTKAAAFITACRIILRRNLKRISHGGRSGEEVETSPEVIQAEMDHARAYLAASRADSAGRVRHLSFENLR